MERQGIHVTPENVVTLAAMFRDCAAQLAPEVRHIKDDLRLEHPWMADKISRWAMEQFNLYFVDSEHAFAKAVQAEFDQHTAMTDALVATAQYYGLTEELAAAGFTNLGPR